MKEWLSLQSEQQFWSCTQEMALTRSPRIIKRGVQTITL